MQVTIDAPNIDLTPEINNQIEQKMAGLQKFYKKIIKAAVIISRDTKPHKQGKIYRITVDLIVPGEDVFAESREEALGTAINEVTKDLIRLLNKKKEKTHDKRRKEGRELNEQIKEVQIDVDLPSNEEFDENE